MNPAHIESLYDDEPYMSRYDFKNPEEKKKCIRLLLHRKEEDDDGINFDEYKKVNGAIKRVHTTNVKSLCGEKERTVAKTIFKPHRRDRMLAKMYCDVTKLPVSLTNVQSWSTGEVNCRLLGNDQMRNFTIGNGKIIHTE